MPKQSRIIMPVEQNPLGQLLFDAGWLPNVERFAWVSGGDLLPSVRRAWEGVDLALLAASRRRRGERMRIWLEDRIADGAQLTILDKESLPAVGWIGERLLWWPRGRPSGALIGIASSRLGRRLDTQADWFTVFRAACLKINRDRDVLLTATATTPERYVERAAELFDVCVVSMTFPRKLEAIGAWLKRMRQLGDEPDEPVHRAYVSPELQPSIAGRAELAQLANLPVSDRTVVSLAERLLVFHLRRGGQLEKLVRARLDDPVWPAASVFIALGEDLVERRLADELFDRGAVGWIVLDTRRRNEACRKLSLANPRAPIVELPASRDWPWLTHCTRAQSGGWPDQPSAEYLDQLLLHPQASDHGAFASIQRIVAAQRLVATSRMIRGDTRVVCFTAVPLRELPGLRSFRSHLGRWDFEPYGICIRRDWLSRRNCRPVHYGDESLWELLGADERPLFQMRTSRSRCSGQTMDWSLEREWRHLGDVDLRELPSDSGLVFAATRQEAEQLAQISRWPVTVLGS